MITLEIYFFGSYGEGKKNLKSGFSWKRLDRFWWKKYVVETDEAIPQKKEYLKKIVAKKNFWIFRIFFFEVMFESDHSHI